VQDYNEECDDGNQLSRDGCSATCEIESGAAPLDGNLMNSSQPYYGNVPQPGRTESGPGLVIFLASGAAAGIGIVRRRLFGAKK
jgi:cysteine-rich repeat protein